MSETTSESDYGISAQPPETCPIIDKAIKAVERAIDLTQRLDREDEEGLRDRLSEIEQWLSELVGFRGLGHLEDIRINATEIRYWGQQWKDLAKDHAPILEEVT